MEWIDFTKAPESPGVYIFYGALGECIYVGSSVNMKRRCQGHIHRKAASTCAYEPCAESELSVKEDIRVRELNPLLNVLARRGRKPGFMSDTRLISLRIPIGLLAEIDTQADREQRSRAKVIIRRLSGVRDRKDVTEIMCDAMGGLFNAPVGQVSSPAAPTKTPGHHPCCGCSICKGSAK
jgi:hypothetical protein